MTEKRHLELVAALVEDEVVRRDAPRAARLRRRLVRGRRRRFWLILGAVVDDEVLGAEKGPRPPPRLSGPVD